MFQFACRIKVGSSVALYSTVVLLLLFAVSCVSTRNQTEGNLYSRLHRQKRNHTVKLFQPGLPDEFISLKRREKREIELIPNNTVQDQHKYYSVEFYHEEHQLWKDLRENEDSVLDTHLSSNVLAVKDVNMSFEFPYYGHLINNAILTTGGFIYLGSSSSRHIAGFQYVAPLMAYFNPALNNTGVAVHHYDDGNEFIVQWSNVHLHDNVAAGSFTFQCILNRTGEIVFSYRKTAIPVANISSAVHAVKVGISDAYYVDKLKHYYGIWRIYRTFYAYDTVHINKSWVDNGTAIVLRPKPNCISAEGCEDCTARRSSTDFNCIWCGKLNRCSDGFDRHRVEWLHSGCNTSGIFQLEKCTTQPADTSAPTSAPSLAPWIIGSICVSAVILLVLAALLVYAITHPTSKSGLCLIQHGPRNCCRKSPNKYLERGPTNSSVFNKVLT